MSCRHEAGDPNCSKTHPRQYEPEVRLPPTPDPLNYIVEDTERVGSNLVMKVRYPNCALCSFEGLKVMVFLAVTEKQALRWRHINPHFRSDKNLPITEAPSPAARFPGSPAGWKDALEYAERRKV